MTEKALIIVKVANQSSDDQRIECDLEWNVLALKQKISDIHPVKPPVKDQKLIYSGHLLQDDLVLKVALRHTTENNEYIIHLVCSATKSSVIHKQNLSTNSNSASPQASNLVSDRVNNSNLDGNSESITDGVRRRLLTAEQPLSYSGHQASFDSSSVYSPHVARMPPALQGITDPIQQMAAMQQMYAHYMTSYMQYIQSGSVDSGRFPQDGFSMGFPSTTAGVGSQGNSIPGPEPQDANNGQGAQRDAQNRANPQAVPDDDEEGLMRDWLDYIYFSTRMGVLVSIVFFYSTFSRFLLVACTSFLLYLYQCGWFRFGINEDPQQGPHGPAPQAQDAPILPNPVEGGRQNDPNGTPQDQVDTPDQGTPSRSTDETTTTNSTPPPAEGLPPQPSILALSWTFLTTFFSSLIPEQPQII